MQTQSIDLPGKRLLRPVYDNRAFKLPWRIFLILLPVVVVVIAPGALLLASNLFGALVAFNVMSTINREREQGTYDLLAMTPSGLGASNWLIAAAWTQRIGAVERLATMRTLAIILLALLLIYSLSSEAITPVVVLALLVGLNLDAIQSLIVGCLSGMLAQQFSGSGSPFAALAIFAFAQVIAVYLPATGAAIFAYDLLRSLGWERWQVESAAALVGVLLLFALHELVIRVMWRQLERRLL
ncbi:MAG: hypothetical protein ABI835_02560 [Chloroflexota bacterium]